MVQPVVKQLGALVIILVREEVLIALWDPDVSVRDVIAMQPFTLLLP